MMAAVLAAYEIKDRKVWGFDSFRGCRRRTRRSTLAIAVINFIDSRNSR
jgi:hypothetical protein